MVSRYAVSSTGGVEKIYTRSSTGGYRPAQPGRAESGREAVRRMLLEGFIQRTDHRGVVRFERIAVRGILDDHTVIASLAHQLKLSESLVIRYLGI